MVTERIGDLNQLVRLHYSCTREKNRPVSDLAYFSQTLR